MTTFVIWALVILAAMGWLGAAVNFSMYDDEHRRRIAAEKLAKKAADSERARIMKFIRSLGVLETAQLNEAALGTSVAMLTNALQAVQTPDFGPPSGAVDKDTTTSAASTNRPSAPGGGMSNRSNGHMP